MARTVYRIVLGNPPSEEDFKTYKELGKTAHRMNTDTDRLMSGLSVYYSFSYARKMAKQYPWKGKCFIAAMELPDTEDVVIEQTGENLKHYTLWCSSDVARASIRSVVPAKKEGIDV